MSGEALGNGYKIEMEAGEETLVPDNMAATTMIEGIYKAIRAKKSKEAVAYLGELVDGLKIKPTPEDTLSSA